MRPVIRTLLLVFSTALGAAADSAVGVREGLQKLSIDPSQIWRVRDLELSRGGAKVYLSEGVLAFATPVEGHRIAAVYTTAQVEAGDAEVLALPPVSAERASLAHFTQSPNLDEHFTSALLFFSDDTATELLSQIQQHPLHPAPDLAAEIASSYEDSLRKGAGEIDIRITQSILDSHRASRSFFYGMMAGRTLGSFDIIFQPDRPDPLLFGRLVHAPGQAPAFQIWSAFRARNLPQSAPAYQITDYHIDTTIHPDLSMSSTADFDYQPDADDGAVITLLLTPRLRATSATIDGVEAPVLMHTSPLNADVQGASTFLIVNSGKMVPNTHHRVKIQYEGAVIRRTTGGAYFVDDRNAWYPFQETLLTVFDLTFHLPENLRLVSTGDPVADELVNGQRTVHRRTAKAQALAGFNVGEFNIASSDANPYRIEICSNASSEPPPDLASQAARILGYFTQRWMPLSSRTLAVTPIEGYFGQGFPGLIYLSNISYLRERNRPSRLRNPMFDSFFSQLLLPHEIAHQWWGNIVTPLDYRSNWIVEAMSNYAALQYLEQTHGRAALDNILAGYRNDLVTAQADGELVDSKGPLTFGQRLQNNFGAGVWHDILYEKGTWIIHMLRNRMGDAAFHSFQLRLLKDFSARPISNEDLREEAAHFIPQSQLDHKLNIFFDTWIYDTGIPILSIKGGSLRMSGVPEAYTLDIPLRCNQSGAPAWLRATTGEFPLPSRTCELPGKDAFLFREF